MSATVSSARKTSSVGSLLRVRPTMNVVTSEPSAANASRVAAEQRAVATCRLLGDDFVEFLFDGLLDVGVLGEIFHLLQVLAAQLGVE